MVALDGTKLAGNASDKANRTLDRLDAEVAEILRQAAETDQREDRLLGDARGDELPEALASKAARLARLRLAKHPRVHLHFTPTYASWLNQVEVFFATIQQQALRRVR
jgi:transposase